METTIEIGGDMKYILIIVTISILIISLSLGLNAGESETLYSNRELNEVIEFNDPELEATIKTAMKHTGDIRLRDALEVTELDLEKAYDTEKKGRLPNCPSLEGLEYFKNLKSLNLTYYQPENITPLGELTQLTDLNLSGYHNFNDAFIENSEALSKLVHLENLDLQTTYLVDVSFLENLKKLQTLKVHFSKNAYIDGKEFNRLKHLRKLFIAGNRNVSLTQLDQLPLLEHLELFNCRVENLDFLSASNQLKYLSADHGGIDDIEGLSSLYELETLILSNNNISDITPLKDLNKLKILKLTQNPYENDLVIRQLESNGCLISK